MAKGRILKKERTFLEKAKEDYAIVDDTKVRMTLIALADKYDERIREIIKRTYEDNELAALYRGIRTSEIYQKGSKSKVHRKIVEFPNGFVFDFCDTVLSSLYGNEWLKDHRALRHELVRPWWVVNKL